MNSDITELNAWHWDLEVLAKRLLREHDDPITRIFAERVVAFMEAKSDEPEDF